jgi:hypothetical protein
MCQKKTGGAWRHMGSNPIPGAISKNIFYNRNFFFGFRLSSVPQTSHILDL